MFLAYAQREIQAYQHLIQNLNQLEFSDVTHPETFSIGLFLTEDMQPLVDKIGTFSKRYSNITVNLQSQFTNRVVDAVQSQELDLGIGIVTTVPNISWQLIKSDELVIVQGAQNPPVNKLSQLKTHQVLAIEDEQHGPLKVLREKLLPAGSPTTIVDSIPTLLGNLAVSDSYALLPKSMITQVNYSNLRTTPIRGNQHKYAQFKLSWCFRTDNRSPILKAFFRHLTV